MQQFGTSFDRLGAWFRGLNPWSVDAVLGTVFTLGAMVALFSPQDPKFDYVDPDALGVALTVGCTLPYYFRRRAPLATLLVSAWSLVALAIVGYPSSVPSQILIVGAYSLGSHAKGWRAPAGLAAMELGVGVVAVVGLPDASTGNLVLAGITYAAAFIFGWAMRTRRLYLEQLEERAALLEREHDEAAKRAVADERLRIAQELHDVVAHSMGVIAVQAGVGIHVIDSDPREAKQSLEAISRTSRGTLTEIRRLLGVLRADDGAAYEPAPGLGDLGRLVTDVATAGLPVDLQFDGTPVEVPPGVDLTAYRIVQEALTNVLKHAGDARATVVVGYEPAALRLEVRDDGLGPNGRADANGHGIVGMRERVAVYGGTLEVGARPGGGFRVVARLPYGEDR